MSTTLPVMTTDATLSLNDARRKAADEAYADYNFGDGATVEGDGSWEHETPGNEWYKTVFLSFDDNDTNASIAFTFTVYFTSETSSDVADVSNCED